MHSICLIIHIFYSTKTQQKAIKSLEFYRNIRSHDDRGLVNFDGEMQKLKTADLSGDTEIRVQLTVHDFSELLYLLYSPLRLTSACELETLFLIFKYDRFPFNSPQPTGPPARPSSSASS